MEPRSGPCRSSPTRTITSDVPNDQGQTDDGQRHRDDPHNHATSIGQRDEIRGRVDQQRNRQHHQITCPDTSCPRVGAGIGFDEHVGGTREYHNRAKELEANEETHAVSIMRREGF
jgi:hypothetical protein